MGVTCEHGPDDQIILRTGARSRFEEKAWLACESCQVLVQRLPLCGKLTRKKTACRIAIRVDRGFSTCPVHP